MTWLNHQYGLHQLWDDIILHYVVGKTKDKRMLHHIVNIIFA